MSRKMSLTGGVLASGLIAAAIFAPAVHADVKTKEKSQLKIEGFLGRFVNGPKEGVTNSVAVKGNRMATFSDQNGQIIDLSEQKIYQVDLKKKEYKVMTFAEMKAMMDKAKADMEKAMKDMPPEMRDTQQPASNLEVTFDVKPGAENKTIAGHQARHMILTVTAKEKGKSIDESGGMVITNEVWLGPRIAALNEVAQFNMKFATAVFGDSIYSMSQQGVASLSAMYPGLTSAMKAVGEQLQKLDGTPLMTIQRTETVKSAAAMSQTQAQPSGGGGLGGMLGRKIMGNKGKPEQRSLLYTSTTETVSIDTTAADADVAIPAGFKEKK